MNEARMLKLFAATAIVSIGIQTIALIYVWTH